MNESLVQLQNDWEVLRNTIQNNLPLGRPLAKLQPMTVQVQADRLDDKQVMDWINAHNAAQGWLMLTDVVQILPLPNSRFEKYPLSAELSQKGSEGDFCSWRLQLQSPQVWTLHEYTVQPCDPNEATHLAETVYHQPTERVRERGFGPLCYLRLWALEDERLTNQLAIFTGFLPKEAP